MSNSANCQPTNTNHNNINQEGCVMVGETLKKSRMSVKMTIAQVSEKLKIRKIYITAIENGDAKTIPSSAYLVGYIKSYANLLEHDPKPLIEAINYQGNETHKISSDENVISKQSFLPNRKILISCILLLVLIYAIYIL